MNRFLRIAGLILALTPLAYPYGNLLKATIGHCPVADSCG